MGLYQIHASTYPYIPDMMLSETISTHKHGITNSKNLFGSVMIDLFSAKKDVLLEQKCESHPCTPNVL